MIKLYQFKPALGLPNASPFCMKVETYLRMSELPYACPRGADVRKAPKGKLPYIEDGAARVADSSFIVDYLKQQYGDKLDAHLSEQERGVALAVQRLIEENLYWSAIYLRWIEDAGFAMTREAFFADMPLMVKHVVPYLARRAMRRELHGHGMGRHSREEIYAIGCRDITALAQILSVRRYFMGERPCSLDATAYAFLANLLWVPLASPLLEEAKKHTNLTAYCERMKARYFSSTPARS
jgi:glutathione S-transferase